MKKIILYFNLLVCLFCLHSCIDDTGNYTYIDEESLFPVVIDGLVADTTVLKGSILELSPIILNDDPSRYSYSWYIMDYTAGGFIPRQWELGEEKDLKWEVSLDPALYRLEFRIKDDKLDIYTRHEMIVNITAVPTDLGLYVLKDDGNQTDIDYIGLKGERNNDILATYSESIPGTGVAMAYQYSQYTHNVENEDGTVTQKNGLSVYHILTSEDIRTYDAKDFTLYKTYEDEFYSAPENCRPQYVTYASPNVYLINDGKLHRIYTMSPNIGKFGAPYSGFYDLSGDMIPYGSYGNYMVFDCTTRSFFEINYNSTSLLPIETVSADAYTLSLQNTNYDLLCAGCNENDLIGTVIIKDRTDNSCLLMQVQGIYDPENWTYKTEWTAIQAIPSNSKVLSTTLMTQAVAPSFFYFLYENSIYSYVLSKDTPLEQRERERLSFPGETITYMTYISGFELPDESTTEALAVLTSLGNNWKLRVYALKGESTPDLNETPVLEYDGTGTARYLLYRSY